VTQAALCRQGAALDIAPTEFPAAADPALTLDLVQAAKTLGIRYHMGVSASVDTFYEGQERWSAVNRKPSKNLSGMTEEYRQLGILNYEMESGTLFKMALVYGFAAACVCGVVAQRTQGEQIVADVVKKATDQAVRVAIEAVESRSSLNS
jgi:uridine phosphorylase